MFVPSRRGAPIRTANGGREIAFGGIAEMACDGLAALGEDLVNDVTVHVGEAHVAAAEPVRTAGVIDPQ